MAVVHGRGHVYYTNGSNCMLLTLCGNVYCCTYKREHFRTLLFANSTESMSEHVNIIVVYVRKNSYLGLSHQLTTGIATVKGFTVTIVGR
jgi:hypothetical protein